jgi:hypothetical protein
VAKLLVISPTAVRVTRVVNKYAAGRRRLTQVMGVDVDFVVDVLNAAVATSVGTQLDAFGSSSSATLVEELQSSGLTGVTDVTLSKGAATNAPPPSPPPLPTLPPLPKPPENVVEDYSNSASTLKLRNVLLIATAAAVICLGNVV